MKDIGDSILTPWGWSRSIIWKGDDRTVADIWCSHDGGIMLTGERVREFREAFPGFEPMAPYNGEKDESTIWLTEDCDWALAVVLWPERFMPTTVGNALAYIKRESYFDGVRPCVLKLSAIEAEKDRSGK